MFDNIAILLEVARAQQRRAVNIANGNELPQSASGETRSAATVPPPFAQDTIRRADSARLEPPSVEQLFAAGLDIHHLLQAGTSTNATRTHLAEMVSIRRGLAAQTRQNRNPLAADEHDLIADAMAVFLAPAALEGIGYHLFYDHHTLCIENHAIDFVSENRHSLMMLANSDSIGRSFLHVKKDQIASDISLLGGATASLSLLVTLPLSLPVLAYTRLRMINKIIANRKTGL